ncbi:uracil-DNA glycosylase [Parvularcula flava]|uniref:Type-5 uracil-DNA glycosylase n=1 Tax=Aquisalinus luteolus TaxID=1566827 RepID=A0A8J3EQK4_9PROT|nr:uracil-DNA glycosylase [Aquisalinus luteolus]NHK27554.1 uracil-DNA glycosylase [Aquisalinus luteolus]GGH95787.1 uracil-DNA glycosylase [Aquisalinus luteolus]
MANPENIPPEPAPDCPLCPRLVDYRRENEAAHPDWFNGAVPSFGPPEGDKAVELIIVGLAPGVQGANKTGRPFTGDYAGDLLYATMLRHGFAKGTYDARPDDGLTLHRAMITNAVRCVPPQNKPTGGEATTCRPFLVSRLNSLPALKVIMCLGRISHDNTLSALGMKRSALTFGHNAVHDISLDGRPAALIDSYHCSRYNTNTGRLTEEMFDDVFVSIRERLKAI